MGRYNLNGGFMKKAFTLAEVLITLGIIGVVAALTMPSLIAKHNEKQTITALKKFYSSISQAYGLAVIENGTPDTWYNREVSNGDIAASNTMVDIITKHMKISKVCHKNKGCFPDVVYKKIDGKTVGNWNRSQIVSKFLTSDGMSVFFYTYGNKPANNGQGIEKVSYGALSVDINGFKGPNTAGQDLFTFIIAKNGIYPHGTKTSLMDEKLDDGTIVRINSFPRMCNRNDCYGNCEACGAWVMYNENLDYMRCDNLSWNGKHSCK